MYVPTAPQGVHAAASDVWPLCGPNVPLAHGAHVGTVLSFQYPAGHPTPVGTQSLFVASHHVDASQSAAEVAHTVEAAASLGSRQQQRRWPLLYVAPQVEEAAELA